MLTQIAIAALQDIATGRKHLRTTQLNVEPDTLLAVLKRLEVAELIYYRESSSSVVFSHYQLARPYKEISLLQILKATGENLDCNYPTEEKLYQQHYDAASRMDIINQRVYLCLAEIKLADL